MEISKKELLMDEIIKQGELGFTKAEIIDNLKLKGLSHEEIKEMKDIIAKSEAKPQKKKANTVTIVFSVLVSLLSFARAIQGFYIGHHTLAAIGFLVLGIICLIGPFIQKK